jgi:nitrogen regulatory protein P-II 1
MKEIKAIIKPAMLESVLIALRHIEGLPGITISEVKGFGKTKVFPSGVVYTMTTKTRICYCWD